ncbi:MAG TPA: molybdopterin-dependent oxidoreductase [Acidimicrobiales bacterium]
MERRLEDLRRTAVVVNERAKTTADRATAPERISPLHEARTAALLGISLGVTFTTCFLTGLYSHLVQHPPTWWTTPARPVGLYRVTQAIHVASGVASIPILLAKLWVVAPNLVKWPPVRSVAHLVERISLLPLVGGGLFMLFSGVANVARWYPWTFFFTTAHFWVAWITIGGLVTHIGAKWALTRDALRHQPVDPHAVRATSADRRAFLGGVAVTSGGLVVATAGGTIAALSAISPLAQRRPSEGPQGLPVNKSAANAGVIAVARDPAYRLVVEGAVGHRLELSIADLRAMPQHEAELPIACVEGWSRSRRWSGVRVRDVLAAAGAPDSARATVLSMQRRGLYNHSDLNRWQAADPDTLLALDLEGEPLHIDHGYPVRLIGPNRPGVLQTKWVSRLVVR